jgi:hypothetical protein
MPAFVQKRGHTALQALASVNTDPPLIEIDFVLIARTPLQSEAAATEPVKELTLVSVLAHGTGPMLGGSRPTRHRADPPDLEQQPRETF